MLQLGNDDDGDDDHEASRIAAKIDRVKDARIKSATREAYHRSTAKFLAFLYLKKRHLLNESFQPPSLSDLSSAVIIAGDLPAAYFAYVSSMFKSAPDPGTVVPIKFEHLSAKDFMEWLVIMNEKRNHATEDDGTLGAITDAGAVHEICKF